MEFQNPKLLVKDVEKTAKALDGIAAAITQSSSDIQNKITKAMAGKLGALGVAGGVSGLLSFGTASTGTAIGALSGAAATSAKMFWVGSLVGGGVAAGTAILAGLSLAGGYFAAKKGAKYLAGIERTEGNLPPEEKRVLNVARKVAVALQADDDVSRDEFAELVKIFLKPLLSDLNRIYCEGRSVKMMVSGEGLRIKPFHFLKLRHHYKVLETVVHRYPSR